MRLLLILTLATSACASAPVPTSAPASVPASLTYLGTAGWKLALGDHTLLVDPYFTRPASTDDAAILVPDDAAIAKLSPARADAILVTHSHYDHALDVAHVALRTGAAIVGTESTANLAYASGVPRDRVDVARVTAAATFSIGPFAIRAIPALHSGTGVPDAPIPSTITLPMTAFDYHQGGTLQYLVRAGGRDVLFIGTAGYVPGALDGLHADVVVMAVGLRENSPGYTCNVLRAVGPPHLVITNHFDDFHAPAEPGEVPLSDERRGDLAAFARDVEACAPGTRVVVPSHFRPIEI